MLSAIRRLFHKRQNVVLPFNTSEGAFAYCCKFMNCELFVGACLPALVLDSRTEFGARNAVEIDPDGHQVVALKVPATDGGFVVMAKAMSKSGPRLEPGQLVAWQTMTFSEEVSEGLVLRGGDGRSGWLGVVMAVLDPIWADGLWKVRQRFVLD